MAAPPLPPIDEEVDAMLVRIRGDETLVRLDLSGRKVSEEVVRKVAEALEDAKRLRVLNLSNAGVTDTAGVVLAESLRRNKTLHTLDLSGNPIGNTTADALLATLRETSTLSEVNVEGTHIDTVKAHEIHSTAVLTTFPAQLKALLPLLEGGSPDLHEVHLEYDCLDPKIYTREAVERLCTALMRHRHVTSVKVDSCFRHDDLTRCFATTVAGNASMTSLALRCVEMGDEAACALATAITHNPGCRLKVLDLHGNQVTDVGAQAIITALQRNHTLTRVDLSNNPVSLPVMHCIRAATALNSQPPKLKAYLPRLVANDATLVSLDLEGGSEGCYNNMAVAVLAEALQANTVVTELCLADNHIGPEGCRHLADVIAVNTPLRKIDLHGNAIGPDGGKMLEIALSKSDVLQHLILDGCGVAQHTLHKIESMCLLNRLPLSLKKNVLPRIKPGHTCDRGFDKVEFPEGGLGPEGADVLCSALMNNRYVTSLSLPANGLGDEGAASVAKLIKGTRVLRSVNLAQNDITDQGATQLLQSLKHNSTVTELELAGNKAILYDLREEIEVALGLNHQAAEVKETICRLGMSDLSLSSVNLPRCEPKINDDAVRLLVDVLIGTSSVTSINLAGNAISDRGVGYLCSWLSSGSCALTSLDLSNNDLGPDAAWALHQALTEGVPPPQLTTLDLRMNHIGRSGEVLVDMVKRYGQLTKVAVQGNNISPATEESIAFMSLLNSCSPEVKSITLGLANNLPSLTTVDVSGLANGDDLLEVICRGVASSSHIERLLLDDCSIGAKGCMALTAAIRGHPSLTEISMRNHNLGDHDLRALGQAIEGKQSHLRTLRAESATVSTEALAELSESVQLGSLPAALRKPILSLKNNAPLKEAVFPAVDASAKVTDQVVALIVSALKRNTHTTSLSLQHHAIGDAGAAKIGELVEANTPLQTIDLTGNRIGLAGLREIVRGVWQNSVLQTLNVSKNALDPDDLSTQGLLKHLNDKLDANKEAASRKEAPVVSAYQLRREQQVRKTVDVHVTEEYAKEMERQIMSEALAARPARTVKKRLPPAPRLRFQIPDPSRE